MTASFDAKGNAVVPQRGVYFLANDAVIDMTIGFLVSFRTYNPTVPLCLVPFRDDDIGELRALADRFDFTIWQDTEALSWCDEISRRFHGRTVGQYRKLALWDGPFDEFASIDTDTVVLANVDFVFEHLDRVEVLTTASDMADNVRFVWKESVREVGALSEEQIGYAANTGFIVSRRGVLSRAYVDERVAAAVELAPHMALDCVEQPLLNYPIVTGSHRYDSLFSYAMRTRRWDTPMELWGGDPTIRVRDGRVVHPARAVLLVHWAGEWARARDEGRQIIHHELFSYYRGRSVAA